MGRGGRRFEEDAEAAEKLLRRLGGDPRAGRVVSNCGSALEDGGTEAKEDQAVLLQIEAEKELRARIAEKKARKEAAASATGGQGDGGMAGCNSDSDGSLSDSYGGSTTGSYGCGSPDGGTGGQNIKTYPIEDSDWVPSNRIYHPEDGPLPYGEDGEGVCLPKAPVPRLFSSLDADSDGDCTGEGAKWQHGETPDMEGDGIDEAKAVGGARCGPQPTQAGLDGREWVPEEELVTARQLPLVRWAEAGVRTDKRALAEIGRS